MKKIIVVATLILFMVGCSNSVEQTSTFYPEPPSNAEGHLFIIGGGERPLYLTERLLSLAGEGEKRVLIVPFASGEPEETGEYQSAQFMEAGATSCQVTLFSREEIDSPESLQMLEGINVIFFSGGSQASLLEHIEGSKFLEKIREIYKRGGVISGTSAGAAVMSSVMITGQEKGVEGSDEGFKTIGRDRVVTTKGFGFLDKIVIDQHFVYRKRENRLFSVLLDNRGYRAVGIDESTAIIVKPNHTFEVFGESIVMLYEPLNSLEEIEGSPSFKITLLSSGESYTL